MYSFAQGLLTFSRFETPPLSAEQQAILYEDALNNPALAGLDVQHVNRLLDFLGRNTG